MCWLTLLHSTHLQGITLVVATSVHIIKRVNTSAYKQGTTMYTTEGMMAVLSVLPLPHTSEVLYTHGIASS